jgi:DNA-binding GntR family transcriptional regulator
MPIAAARNTRHRTKQEFAYQTLRDAIMRCELVPGERLVIDDLARRLRVSTIPIREAIQMLQSEGLVVTVPHTGVTVAPVSSESIQDVFAVLEGLEVVASRLVAERAQSKELNALAKLVADMDRAVASKQHGRWAGMNTQFHLTIGRLPGLPMLAEMTERVLARWDRIRRYFFRGVLVHRIEQAQQEHREMLAAMRAADLPRLEMIVREHNRHGVESYMSYLRSSGKEPAESGSSGAFAMPVSAAARSPAHAPPLPHRPAPSARRRGRNARLRPAGPR